MKKTPSVTVIITAFEEPTTIGRAIERVLVQINKKKDQILVVAPDRETLAVARQYPNSVTTVRDRGEGKPAALNLAVKKAKGEILALTDGDVYIGKKSLVRLVKKMRKRNFGAVSGRPVSLNNKQNLWGYWAYVLTQTAHRLRKRKSAAGKFLDCSGYLYAVKKDIFPHVPENVVTDDAYISRKIYTNGARIGYEPAAKVYVKFPTNWPDWLKQKVRNVAGATGEGKTDFESMRDWPQESKGCMEVLRLAKTPKETFYITLLFFARLWVWLLAWWKVKVLRHGRRKIWLRIESTK